MKNLASSGFLALTSVLAILGAATPSLAYRHGVPAPELGATAVGTLMAVAIAVYAKRRGKRS